MYVLSIKITNMEFISTYEYLSTKIDLVWDMQRYVSLVVDGWSFGSMQG